MEVDRLHLRPYIAIAHLQRPCSATRLSPNGIMSNDMPRANSNGSYSHNYSRQIYSEPASDEYDELTSHAAKAHDGNPFGDHNQQQPDHHYNYRPMTYPQPPSLTSRNATSSLDYEERSRQGSTSSLSREPTFKDKLSQFTAIAKDKTEKWSKIAAEKGAVYGAKAKDMLDEAYNTAKERVGRLEKVDFVTRRS